MARFNGTFQVSIDDKNRIAVPSPFRRLIPEVEGESLYLVAHLKPPYPHIKVYPSESFAALQRMIEAIPDPHKREQRRFLLVGGALPVSPDGQGRVLLGSLRDKLGFQGNRLMVVGQTGTFDLYDEATYTRREQDALREMADEPLDISWA